ncbi:hypothetical protein Zmor_014610 [Zophobas morio]|uniref:Uncharacterized protein n=1 Tax=Zophobas morio TaxID=2755281 RepID=A0AA38MGZ6_9CUCU|nr:hypothetical protein Zmor_014610 [Zophobas morio]
MFRRSQTDTDGHHENSNNLNPQNNYSCSLMSHSKNTVCTTPMRSSFRRYFLADTWHTPSLAQKKIDSEFHFSTKIDCESPGYSSRVVRYNEEQGKPQPSHLCKYDKLGVFPIVHFFKKELPYLRRKGVKAQFSLNSLEISKLYAPDHNQLLLEEMIKSSPGSQETVSNNPESNTKSVLDALKEISGKRIHADGEEFILKEDGKRMYINYDSESNSSKRVKQNSQVEDFTRAISPIRTAILLDELMASCSSMDEQKKSNITRHSVQTVTPLKPFTTAEYVDVETQTNESQVSTNSTSIDNTKEVTKEVINPSKTRREVKVKKVSPIKIFDETPLETMRKNRLTALMGSLTENKLQNKIPLSTQQSEDKFVLDKPLVSILVGNTKNLRKSVKHVTFDVPEVVDLSDAGNNTNASKDVFFRKTDIDITRTSTAICSPIVSASITESDSSQKMSGNFIDNVTPLLNSSNTLVNHNQKIPNSKVNLSTSLSSSQVILNNTVTWPFTQNQHLVFINDTVEKNVSECNAANASVINKGVGIQLKKKMVDNSFTTEINETAFPAANTSQTTELKETVCTQTLTMAAPVTFTAPTTSINSKSTTSCGQENSNIFSDTSTNQSFSIPSVGPFSINKCQTGSTQQVIGTSAVSINTFEQPVISQTSCTFPTNSHMKTSTQTFNTCSVPTNEPTSFVGVSSSQLTTPNFASSSFGSNNSSLNLFSTTVVTKSPLTFSVATTPNQLSFNAHKSTSSTTSAVSSSSKEFESSNSSTSKMFPENSNKTPTNSFFFNESNCSFLKKSACNSESTTSSSYGVVGNIKTMFGYTSPTLLNDTTSNFGRSSGNRAGVDAFENVITTTSAVSVTNSFTTSTDLPAFGASKNPNFTPNNFGINQKSNFNSNLGNDFKNTPPSFGSSFNKTFGGNTNVCGFATNASGALTNFDSNRDFGQTNNVGSSSSFSGMTSSFEKPVGANTGETTAFDSTNHTLASTNLTQNSQSNIFTFGTNNTNKTAIFSFATNQAVKSPFTFQEETNVNVFGNKNLSDNASSVFNSSTNSQFNVQPSGGNMFNIGVGNSTPSRMRAQHKTKRRN